MRDPKLKTISEISVKAGIGEKYVEPYGFHVGKIDLELLNELAGRENGKLVLVTAMTPTKAGEGKTTTSISLADGLWKIGERPLLCLREPALGPVFGLKGGATGGGLATIEPSEDINLHFTGDIHALTSAINLVAAIIDNHVHFGNELGIDPSRITWKRALDVNDRALRLVEIGRGKGNGPVHESGFLITVASEMMAIFALAKSEDDFLRRLEKVIVAYTYDNRPVTIRDLRVTHAVMRLVRNALRPNLVQTSEGNPCFVHGGPFANIAHGCSSIISLKMAVKLAPIVITEAGFGADLGAEKFLDIVVRESDLKPDLAILVVTIRAMKFHGGQAFDDLGIEDFDALEQGLANPLQHLENLGKFGLKVIVAVNRFPSDTEREIEYVAGRFSERGFQVSVNEGFLKGGEGAKDLAFKVREALSLGGSSYHPLYPLNWSLKEKIETISKEIYRADEVVYAPEAAERIRAYEEQGFGGSYVCMAKVPTSFTDNAKTLNAPKGFKVTVKDVNLSAGACFVVPLLGDIMTMPGLPKKSSAEKMEDTPWKL